MWATHLSIDPTAPFTDNEKRPTHLARIVPNENTNDY
jgi:hypothetical protein